MADLATRDEALLAEQDQPRNLLEVIYRAAMDPRVDVEKMSALVALKERIDAREAEIEFDAALSRLMPKMPRIEKDGAIRNQDGSIRSRYAKYEDIDAATRPILSAEGFAFSFDTDDSVPKSLKIIAILSHRMGHKRVSNITLPIEVPTTRDGRPLMTGAQATGSVMSFGKRQLVTGMLNLVCVGEDNDGRGPQAKITDEQVMTIDTLLQDTKANRAKFLEWAGVDRVEDILAKDHRKVMSMLEAKARK